MPPAVPNVPADPEPAEPEPAPAEEPAEPEPAPAVEEDVIFPAIQYRKENPKATLLSLKQMESIRKIDDNDQCAICHETFSTTADLLRVMKCGHVFHRGLAPEQV
eukprot:COSAG01_NODE_4488_length_4979_cov_4.046293_9_plen_105_part_00